MCAVASIWGQDNPINFILCSVFLKVRHSTDMAASQTENEDVTVAGNAAYELTRHRLKAARQPVVSTEEPLYEEVPA